MWGVIQGFLGTTKTQAASAQACLGIDVEAIKCLKSGTDAANGSIKRGTKEATIANLKLIFEKTGGSTQINTTQTFPAPLETKIVPLSIGFAPEAVQVAVGITNPDGSVSYCEPSKKQVCV